jgi:hypothetical protein
MLRAYVQGFTQRLNQGLLVLVCSFLLTRLRFTRVIRQSKGVLFCGLYRNSAVADATGVLGKVTSDKSLRPRAGLCSYLRSLGIWSLTLYSAHSTGRLQEGNSGKSDIHL